MVNRPTDGGAKLIAAQRWLVFRWAKTPGARIERIIAKKLEERPVQAVGSRFGY